METMYHKIVKEDIYKDFKYYIREVGFKSDDIKKDFFRFIPTSWLCGYVAIPEGHPLYNNQEDEALKIPVHGGITCENFISKMEPEYFKEKPCEYVIGFDVNHGWDREYIMDIDYVEVECKTLIEYIIENY